MANEQPLGQDPHAEETKARWGHTDAYKESARRTKSYTPEDWTRIKAENEQIEVDFATALGAGFAPDSEQALALAERARLHVDRWYYPCTPAQHAMVAELYTADPRFREHYEKRTAGLAEFVAQAIRANATRTRTD